MDSGIVASLESRLTSTFGVRSPDLTSTSSGERWSLVASLLQVYDSTWTATSCPYYLGPNPARREDVDAFWTDKKNQAVIFQFRG